MPVEISKIWETLCQAGLIPAEMRAILLVGSYARGWANADSDIDIIAIEDTRSSDAVNVLRVPLDPPDVPYVSKHIESRGWEVKYWLVKQVDQLLDKVSLASFERAGYNIVEQEELFLERLITAIPVRGADWLAEIQSALDRSAFRTQVVSRSLGNADKAVLDAWGQAEAGDLTSATLSARNAYAHAVDALLESHDVYGSTTTKWRARRVQDAALPMLPFEEYWSVETMEHFDRDNLREWVDDTVKRARKLMMSTQF